MNLAGCIGTGRSAAAAALRPHVATPLLGHLTSLFATCSSEVQAPWPAQTWPAFWNSWRAGSSG